MWCLSAANQDLILHSSGQRARGFRSSVSPPRSRYGRGYRRWGRWRSRPAQVLRSRALFPLEPRFLVGRIHGHLREQLFNVGETGLPRRSEGWVMKFDDELELLTRFHRQPLPYVNGEALG